MTHCKKAQAGEEVNTEGSYFDLLSFAIKTLEFHFGWSRNYLNSSQQLLESKLPQAAAASEAKEESADNPDDTVVIQFGAATQEEQEALDEAEKQEQEQEQEQEEKLSNSPPRP